MATGDPHSTTHRVDHDEEDLLTSFDPASLAHTVNWAAVCSSEVQDELLLTTPVTVLTSVRLVLHVSMCVCTTLAANIVREFCSDRPNPRHKYPHLARGVMTLRPGHPSTSEPAVQPTLSPDA